MRYALGKSAAKHPEELYFSGEIAGRDKLVANLENEFNIKGKVIDLKTAGTQGQEAEDYFKLNLIKEYTASLTLRRQLQRFANLALIAVILVLIFVLAGNLKLDGQIKVLKKDYDPSKKAAEYGSKINDLQNKIRLLKNEK